MAPFSRLDLFFHKVEATKKSAVKTADFMIWIYRGSINLHLKTWNWPVKSQRTAAH